MTETARKKLVIVDGYSLLYRAFFALPKLTTAGGLHTNAVFGFSTMLLRLLEEEKPDYCLVAFDAPGGSFRHAEYSEYKATRPRTPDELGPQVAYAHALCEALRIPIVEVPGYEADDVVGAVARRAAEAGLDVRIVTGDLDALQLVSERVQVLATVRGISETVRYDCQAVQDRYGLAPEQIPDYKALVGDPSDNIPGVRGIGEKTATKLLQRYGTLEEVLAHRAEIPEARVRASLEAAGEQPRASRQLATIVTDVPLPLTLEEARCSEPDREKVLALFDALEFRSLRKKFEAASAAPPAAGAAKLLNSEAALAQLMQDARVEGGLSLALPPPEEKGRAGQLTGLARLGLATEAVAYCWDPAQGGIPLDRLRVLLEDAGIPKCAHDLKRVLLACRQSGVALADACFDPMVADYLLDPTRTAHTLEAVAFEHLGIELPEGKDAAALTARAEATSQLWKVLPEKLRAAALDVLNREVEVPLIRVLADMEQYGMAVDAEALRNLSRRLESEIRRLEGEIFELAGVEFNIGSTKQLQFILFEKLGLPVERRTKTGYSTSVDVLENLAASYPIAAKILAYRELAKLKSTYADALPRQIDPRTGRVHTTFNQTVTATGRLSSSEPNLQNIPVRSEIGREIRRAFIAPPGMLLLGADYSQIELRILAHVSGDEELLRAFAAEEDIHVRTAALIFGVSESAVTPEMRRRAKTINFAVLYGMSEFGLARDLGVPVATARDWIAGYFNRYPGVLRYKENTLDAARRQGYVSTLLGRRRLLPEIRSRNRNFREIAERAAVNTPIQGTAADIIKLAMLRVDEHLRAEHPGARMLLQVHDELLFETPAADVERLADHVRAGMETALDPYVKLRAPLRVTVSQGPNWAETQQIM